MRICRRSGASLPEKFYLFGLFVHNSSLLDEVGERGVDELK